MIDGKIIGDKELLERLRQVTPTLRTAMDKTIAQLCLNLSARVKVKLSGEVLKNRTGRLRRSINFRMTGEGSDNVAGYVGTNVEYARAHEYGFHGVVTVKEHLRMQIKAFGKAMKEPRQVTVKAHAMKMDIPEKSFLRSALEEMQPVIKADIEKATQRAAKDAMK